MIALTIATTTPIDIQVDSPAPPCSTARSMNGLRAARKAGRSAAPISPATSGKPSNSKVSTSAARIVRAISRSGSCISSPK